MLTRKSVAETTQPQSCYRKWTSEAGNTRGDLSSNSTSRQEFPKQFCGQEEEFVASKPSQLTAGDNEIRTYIYIGTYFKKK